MTRRIAVFGSSRTPPGSAAWEEAYAVGLGLANAGFSVVTGGYGGSMEAVSAGAAAAGKGTAIVGVTAPALFPGRSGANRFVSEEWQAKSLSERIGLMLANCAAMVALPGSIGTLTEIMMAWNDGYLDLASGREPKPLIVVGNRWGQLLATVAKAVDTSSAPILVAADGREAIAALAERLALET